MKRLLLIAISIGLLGTPLLADVTIKQTSDGKVLGFGGKTAVTTFIKGNKMRSDAVAGDKTLTTIFDVDAQKMYIFDSKKKEADVWDMAAFGAELGKVVDPGTVKGSIKPNGQTKQISGKSASGYDMQISVQAASPGSKEMNMTVNLQGPSWIVKGAPGTADFARFYRAAADKGFIFMNPQAAKAAGGQAKAMSEMYRQMAEIGGIPYEQTVEIKLSGSGPMAGLMARMGGSSFVTTVDSIETGALSDDLFAPPAGYKLNLKK